MRQPIWHPLFQIYGRVFSEEGVILQKKCMSLRLFYGGSCPFWSEELKMRDQRQRWSLSLSGSRGSRHIKDNRR